MKVADAVAVAGHEVHLCRYRFNAAAPVTPLVAAADRGTHGDGGAIVLVRARRPGGPATGPGRSARR